MNSETNRSQVLADQQTPVRQHSGDRRAVVSPKVGDFAVLFSGWSHWDCGQVLRVTDKFIWRTGGWNDKGTREDRSKIVFAGPEPDAKFLHERLTSSDALHSQEVRAAGDRLKTRNDKLIAAAFAKATGAA